MINRTFENIKTNKATGFIPYIVAHYPNRDTFKEALTDVLGHDGHTLGVDGAQVGVLGETNQVSLGSLLGCEHSSRFVI